MPYEWDNDQDSYEPDYPGGQSDRVTPVEGTYLSEVMEGIELKLNSKTQKYTIWIPFKTIKALEDERGNGVPAGEGAEVTDFISPSHEFTMKRLGFIISCSKYRNDFTKKYSGIPSKGEPEFDTFILDLKRYLPSTRVIATLGPSKTSTKPMMNIKSYRKVGAKGPSTPSPDERPGW